MKKTTYLLLATTVFVVLFASACGGSAAPATQAAPPPAATQAPAAGAAAPAQQPAAAAQGQSFAPACQAAASCAAPAVKDTEASNTFCVEKIPYQNINVEPGTTFESLDPSGELKCKDSGTVVDGKTVITCSGKQLWTYQLKLTNSACSGGALTNDPSKCQAGSGYDAAQNCCAPVTGGAGSVTIKVNLGACALPK
jgi:hypothetical protein